MNFTNPVVEPADNKWAVPQCETTEPENRGTSNASWVFILALAVGLVGLACFGYLTLKKTALHKNS